MFLTLLTNVCQQLNQLGLPYMLTGSAALEFHTVGRSTRDLDVVIELNETQIELFLAVFTNHYYHQPSIITEVQRGGMFNLIDFETGFKIDFILRKDTEYGRMAFSRRSFYAHVLPIPVWVISLEDLIIAKLLWIQEPYSDRQAADIKQLLRNPVTDYAYLHRWIRELRLNTFDIAL